MSARATTRKRLTADERRAAILAAALEVFAGRGYHASSIDEIARTAGISKALIYEHFPSKEELHLELLQQNASELFERLAAAAVGVERGAPRLESGVDAFFRFVDERRGAWRMLFRETTEPGLAEALDRIVAQVTAVVAGLIAEDPAAHTGQVHGRERSQAIQMLAQMLVGAVQSLANWWADHQEVRREVLVEMVMDFAWLGMERLQAGERWANRRR